MGVRTKDGMNTKPHSICDGYGRRMNVFVASGQVSGYTRTWALVRSLPKVNWLPGDPGFETD